MSYKKINMDTYERKDYFKHFLNMDNPFIETTVQVDITDFYNKIRSNNLPFNISLMYMLTKSANAIKEFRQRILDDEIIEYDFCRISYNVNTPSGRYVYCHCDESLPYEEFIVDTRNKEAEAKKQTTIIENDDPLGRYFVSCLPWISFTYLKNPYSNNRFSNPTFLIGKYYTKNEIEVVDNKIKVIEKRYVPINVFVHHGLVDGRQVGEFYTNLDNNLKEFSNQ